MSIISPLLQGGEGVYQKLCNAISDYNHLLSVFYGQQWLVPKVREGGIFAMWKGLMQKEANRRKYVVKCLPITTHDCCLNCC